MSKIKIDNLTFSYGGHRILTDVSARIRTNCITAITGPSGQGKSTFLTILNRLCENNETASLSGKVHIRFDGKYQNIFHPKTDVMTLRRKVALVFQVPNPLPMSIYKNVAFGLKLKGGCSKGQIKEKVVHALERSFLFKEVENRLNEDARLLSGGQQQRLCIARALILDPEVLLLDEPTSSLDEKSGIVIENLLTVLKENCTILLVSHSSGQVQRIADECLNLSDQCLTPQDIRGDLSLNKG